MSRRRVRVVWTVLYVAVVASLVALIVPAWQRYSDGPSRAEAAFRPPPAVHRAAPRVRRVATPAPVPTTVARIVPKPVRLVLVARRGDCWVRVRAGSPTGRVLFEGTVAQGARRTFTGRRIVVFAGAPQNLDVSVAGATHTLGSQTLWVATPDGLAPLRL